MAKLHKYLIVQNDLSTGHEDAILFSKIGKGEVQKWLYKLNQNLTDGHKRQFLLPFYDKHINDHNWSSHTLDFLTTTAINTRFLKIIGKPFRVGGHVYTIEETPESKKLTAIKTAKK